MFDYMYVCIIKVIVLDNLQRVVITFQCNQSLIAPQANEIRRSEIE